ncbi:Dihydrolipoyllysine-residue acetyltransferase component of pyruvate dehydrogenase complex [Chlamydiales bacterium SCGC AG-110-P3]|nr:Dihydrolipoyllysine-residue acetyltransferase component of pyruvate dehydrogenase complex [Chlamydiales bacterium SCGC AG-110-P3]
MPFTLTMPKLSPTMSEGTITAWHKTVGDHVEAGDLIIEVATDKATVEHCALDEGFLRKILIDAGQEAIVNQPIAIFTEAKDESIDGYEPEGITAVAEEALAAEDTASGNEEEEPAECQKPAKMAAGAALALPVFAPEPPLLDYKHAIGRSGASDRLVASPLARRLAEEKGLDINTVKGTGPRGRIMARDLEMAQSSGVVAFSRRKGPTMAPGTYEELPLSPMRKSIANRLQEAKTFIPHFYTEQEVDAVPMADLRNQLKSGGVKVTYNDFVMRGCALALKKHPVINSGFNTETQSIVQYNTIDISVAVSVDGGLITPIVRHADYKNIGELSVEVKALARRARDGKLESHEYRGGSFTVSNLGMYGITKFSAIINPPQGAILAVGGISDVAAVKDGAIVPGKRMTCTLSADHRVIDGSAAAEFLCSLKGFLENPGLLLV